MTTSVLERIQSPQDLLALNSEEISLLCEELRQEIIAVTTRNGGHLASNLGAVELTVAAYLAYAEPTDQILWDVGHQSYAHKILTGRRDLFHTLRTAGGISGFPKREESPYDRFNTGHSSTALSAAIGIARAKKLLKEPCRTLAIVGDGSFGGGMNWEALNDAGQTQTPVVVLLNDNAMSINRNVGAISVYFSRLRSNKGYVKFKRWLIRKLTRSSRLYHMLDRAKSLLKFILTDGTLFEEMGWTYLGPVDGHNVADLAMLLRRAQHLERPVLLHAVTQKGTGMVQAERNPSKYHAVGPWFVEKVQEHPGISMAYQAGLAVLEAARGDVRVCAVTAAMTDGVGLGPFQNAYPERFFDTGITEPHAVTMAAGLAAGGMKPIVCIYATFLQRAYDSLLHDVGLQNLPVVFLVSHCGCVGEDGETHQGIYYGSMFLPLPNFTVYALLTPEQLPRVLHNALRGKGPVAICYPKEMDSCARYLPEGEAPWPCLWHAEGAGTAFLAVGRMVSLCLKAAANSNVPADVIGCDLLAPLPEEGVGRLMHYKRILVAEDHERDSGAGVHIQAELLRRGFRGEIQILGHVEKIIHQATWRQQITASGLDAASLKRILEEGT